MKPLTPSDRATLAWALGIGLYTDDPAVAFDRICDHLDMADAKSRLSQKKKHWCLNRYLQRLVSHRPEQFADVCLRALRAMQGRHVHAKQCAADAALRQDAKKRAKLEERAFLASWRQPISRAVSTAEGMQVIATLPETHFRRTPEWRQLRYEALRSLGKRCVCCGAAPGDGVRLDVEHLQPRWLYPEQAFDIRNVRVVCMPCLKGSRQAQKPANEGH